MAIQDTARRKVTYEDYALIPEDLQRHEILDREHYVTPSPPLLHQTVSGNLLLKLAPFVREHRLGKVIHAFFDVLLSEHDIVQPDLLFISKERVAILTKANAQGAPDLLIEILSEPTRIRDETLKRDRYERYGVLEYWVVDPENGVVRVYRRAGDFCAPRELSAAAGDVLPTPLLPGLEIRVGEVFE